MQARTRRRRLMNQINVVPYIDVSLVLLIIFMITAPLLTRGVKVNLPRANAQAMSQKQLEAHQPIVLTVGKGGQFYMNIGAHPNRTVTAQMVVAMTQIVLKRSPGTPVLVRGDAQARYAEVVRGMVLLQSAGARNIGLITKPPAKPLVRKSGP